MKYVERHGPPTGCFTTADLHFYSSIAYARLHMTVSKSTERIFVFVFTFNQNRRGERELQI